MGMMNVKKRKTLYGCEPEVRSEDSAAPFFFAKSLTQQPMTSARDPTVAGFLHWPQF